MNLVNLVNDARKIAMLICPMPFQLEDGDAVERMPEDLFGAATIIGRLCDALEQADAVIANQCFDERVPVRDVRVWADEALERHRARQQD